MKNSLNRVIKSWKWIAGSCVAVGIGVTQLSTQTAQGSSTTFTRASLQGTYAYVNAISDVASFGPIVFNGNGGLRTTLEVNLPCPATPTVNCPRSISQLSATGTYSVRSDGTGVATINFPAGTTVYSFIITEATNLPGRRLATKVFAAARTGGLNGQLIAPTFIRR